MSMNLYQILDVMWRDEFLGWDPNSYGGINWTVLDFKGVWLPDTYLYNNLQMGRDTSECWINVIITTNTSSHLKEPVAQIRTMYPAIYLFSCKMYILYFPFDRQNCTMMFGSWTYDASGIRYFAYLDYVRNESYVENEEWSVWSFEIIRHENKYTCCPHPYTELHAHLVIQRKPLYYIVNLVVPTTIISLIAVVGFFTPDSSSGDRSEKLNLGIATLLAMSIFLLMVSDQMPRTSNFVPLIGWYFLSIIIFISLGTFLTTIMISMQSKGRYGEPVPGWAKTICFDCLSPCLLMSPPKILRDKFKKQKFGGNDLSNIDWTPDYKGNYFGKDIVGEPVLATESMVNQYGAKNTVILHPRTSPSFQGSPLKFRGGNQNNNHSSQSSPLKTEELPLYAEIKKIQKKLQKINDYFEAKDEDDAILLQWEYLTSVLDRFCFVLFAGLILFVTVLFLILGSYNYSASNA